MKVDTSVDPIANYFEETLERPITVTYKPAEDEGRMWMYAMISLGCAFVIFVIASIYLMCNSPVKNQPVPAPMKRTPSKAQRERNFLHTETEQL